MDAKEFLTKRIDFLRNLLSSRSSDDSSYRKGFFDALSDELIYLELLLSRM